MIELLIAVVSGIGVLFLLLISIIGFFVQRTMNTFTAQMETFSGNFQTLTGSVQDLNVKVAVVITQLGNQDARITKLEESKEK